MEQGWARALQEGSHTQWEESSPAPQLTHLHPLTTGPATTQQGCSLLLLFLSFLLFFPERIHCSPNHPHSLTIPVIKISQSPEHKPSINFAGMFSMLQTQQALSRSSRRCTGSWLRAADTANISESRALNREWGISGLPWKCEVSKWHLTLTQLSSPISNPSQSLFESLLLDPSLANFFGSVIMTSI